MLKQISLYSTDRDFLKLAPTYCFRESPPSLGPFRRPQKILVLITRSVRRNPSSLITRPLEISQVPVSMGVCRYKRMRTHISSSDFPPAYASAVSNIFIPASNAVLIISYSKIRALVILKRPENPFLTLTESPFTVPPKVSPFGERINLKIENQIWNRSTYSLLKKISGHEAHLVLVDGMACS